MYKTEHYICCDWCGNRRLLEYKHQSVENICGWGEFSDGSHACPECVKKLNDTKEVRLNLNDDDVSELKKMLEREMGECTVYSEREKIFQTKMGYSIPEDEREVGHSFGKY